jgi:hypothetical protein
MQVSTESPEAGDAQKSEGWGQERRIEAKFPRKENEQASTSKACRLAFLAWSKISIISAMDAALTISKTIAVFWAGRGPKQPW